MSKHINIEIPEDIMDQVCRYIERLKMVAQPEDIVTEITNEECEVKSIISHRITDKGKWQFLVSWKNYNSEEWVDDENCNCEKLISEYLKDKNIHTAYIFCRVSTPKQATTLHLSLQAQEAELYEAVSKMCKFSRIRVYKISQSAYRSIPQILQRIGNICLPNDGIFFWRVDRLSRNIIKYLNWLENLNDRGVILYSHNEGITYRKNKLLFLQAVLDAQKEAELLGERIKLAYRIKRNRGDERVGSLPYGKKYQQVLDCNGKVIKKIVIDNPTEKALIERICRSSKDAQTLAMELNLEGIRKKNKKWNRGMILRIRRDNPIKDI